MRLRRRLAAFVEIRRGEETKTILMFFYFFLVLTSYYVLKPVRNSLFLENLGPQQLPYIYLATAVIIGGVVAVYARLMERFERHLLIMASTAFFAANLVLFWWFFSLRVPWMSALLYLWAAIFSVGAVTQFWSIANEIFNPEEAKRLFGLVGAGGVLGGIVGGMLSNLLVKRLGTENLLLVSAAILTPCVAIIAAIHRREEHFRREAAPARRAERPLAEYEAPLRTVLGSSYLRLLAVMMIVMVVVATLVDYGFNTVAAAAFVGKDAKTAFFGVFFAALSALSLAVQFLLTSPVLRLLGVGAALLLLPVSLAAASLSVFALPALWSASALKLADGSLRYSLNQTTREVLYLPVPLAEKYAAKAFIDVTLQRWARGGAALLILAAIGLRASWTVLALVTIAFCAGWVLIVLKTRDHYLLSLGRLLGERPARPPGGLLERPREGWPQLSGRGAVALAAAAEPSLVPRLLAAPDPLVRAAALQRLSATGQAVSPAELEPLLEDKDAVVRERAYVLLCAQGGVEVAGDLWIDPGGGRPPQLAADYCSVVPRAALLLGRGRPEDRARAATLLAVGPRAADYVTAALAGLITDPDGEVRRAAIAAAATLRDDRLVPALLHGLRLPCPGAAAAALIRYGPRAAHLIAPALAAAEEPGSRPAARQACQVLAAIGGDEATAVLVAALARPALRLPALRALADMEPAPRIPAPRLEQGYREAFGSSARATVILGDYQAFRRAKPAHPKNLLERALLEAQREGFEEAVLWQELLAPGRRLAATVGGLTHWAKELRAASQELLAAALPREAGRLLAVILSERPYTEQADAAASLARIGRRHFLAWLPALLADPRSPAIRLGAIYAVASHPPTGYQSELARIARTASGLESQLASAALPPEGPGNAARWT